MMYVVFPLGRWIDHATVSTLLLVGLSYASYFATRLLTVPSFLRGGL